MSIAFLGPAGTFTESALRQIEPDPAHHLPVASVPAALAAVRDGRAASAVVPIENSVEGGVTATLDALADGTELPADWATHAERPAAPYEVDPAEIETNREDWLLTWNDLVSR